MANSPWHTDAITKRQWAEQHTLLDVLYGVLSVDAETPFSMAKFRELSNGVKNVDKALKYYLDADLVTRRTDRSYKTSPAPVGYWTLTMDRNPAHAALTGYQQRVEEERIAANKAKAVGPRSKAPKDVKRINETKLAKLLREPSVLERPAMTETEAIVGPEPANAFASLAPLRKNEAAALVEAARQYANRDTTVNTQLDQMEAAMKAIGVTFDRSLVQGAVVIERDERLESVALVLPYINQLEQGFARVTDELAQARAKLAEMPDLKRNSERQKAQIDRLISERDAYRRRD